MLAELLDRRDAYIKYAVESVVGPVPQLINKWVTHLRHIGKHDQTDTSVSFFAHKPPEIDGHLVQRGDTVYAFIASGDMRAVRRQHPSWVVWHMSDVAAALSGRLEDMMSEVTASFPDARVVAIRQGSGGMIQWDGGDIH